MRNTCIHDPKTGRIVPKDLTGHQFDRLTVLSMHGKCPRGHYLWSCVCQCGARIVRRGDYLVRGKNQSCGCLAKEIGRKTRIQFQTTHGMSRTPTGKSWMAMMDRCFNSDGKDYKRYGLIGRTVCEFLRASPLNLLCLIGERPVAHSIDRINNKGSYTCGQCRECLLKKWPMNVRWATPIEQARNK